MEIGAKRPTKINSYDNIYPLEYSHKSWETYWTLYLSNASEKNGKIQTHKKIARGVEILWCKKKNSSLLDTSDAAEDQTKQQSVCAITITRRTKYPRAIANAHKTQQGGDKVI